MKGLYIHIPFCIKKCEYCDFNSFAAEDTVKESYVSALISEMAEYKGAEINTVYIGGGTPTTLKKGLLSQVIEAVKENFELSENTEFTVEMNPKTADFEKLKVMYELGVTRISIGVQSFCDNELKALGRVHTAADAKDAIALARSAGFKNISLDLMSAIPEQTMESFSETLKTAISQNPDHISCYSLTVHEHTVFHINGIDEPMEEFAYDAYKKINDWLDTKSASGTPRFTILSTFSSSTFSIASSIKSFEKVSFIFFD